MDLKFLLTSFQGRIRRTHFWLAGIGTGVVMGVLASVIMSFSGIARGAPNPIALLLLGVLYVVAIFISLAVDVKRCHDRDKSGWFLLIGLIPLIGGLWLLIDLGFLDGTPGPNKFGPSPKGVGGDAAVAA
jgi:uncharacterized membrane protein YhaH (DUF805 family)